MNGASRAIPFQAASHRHFEGPFADVSFTPGAATTNLLTGTAGDVPAYPYLRACWLRVTTSGGTAGAGVNDADFPWNIFQSIQLADTNGTAIFGGIGTFSGFDAYLANKWGGYRANPDPSLAPDFTNGIIAYSFGLRVPVEFDPYQGMGALGNMSANAPFRLTLIGNTTGAIHSTAPTAESAVRTRCYIETWTLPTEKNLKGIPQQQIPPGGIGTTQYWRKQNVSVTASSQNVIKFNDVGNLIRTWILVARSSAANSNRLTQAAYPDPYNLNWDGTPLVVEPAAHRRVDMAECLDGTRYNTAVTAPPFEDGILVFSFANPREDTNGSDGPESFLPTLQSTRLEFSGAFGASITNMDIITNSVAAVETGAPYSFGGETGQLVGPAQPSTRS